MNRCSQLSKELDGMFAEFGFFWNIHLKGLV